MLLFLSAQFAHPRRRAIGQLRMILVTPGRFGSAEKSQQLTAFELGSRRFDQKRAAAPRSYECIDLLDQIAGKYDMGSLSVHMKSHS